MRRYKKMRLTFFIFCLLSLIITADIKANQLSDVSFSADGGKILSRYRNKINVWETRTGKLLRTFETETDGFKYAAFLPGGKTIFSVNGKAEMLWLDVETGESKNKISGKTVYPYAISADGETIAHASTLKNNDEEIIEFYDTANGKLKKSFQYPSNFFACLAFSPNGEKLLAVGDNVSVISLKTGKIEKSFDLRLPILNCAVSARGDSVLGSTPVITSDDNLQIFSLQNNQKYSGPKKEANGQIGDIGAVGYSPADPDLAFAAGKNQQTDNKSDRGLLILWNTKSGNVKQTLKTVSPMASAAFSTDGKSILVQEVSGFLTLFNIETGAVIRKYPDKAEISSDSASKCLHKRN